MLPEYFAIIGAIIASIGGVYYLWETLKGRVQPNRVTYFLWGTLPMVTFFAQKSQDVESIVWVTFASAFMPILILLASVTNKKAFWKTKRSDYALFIFSIFSVFLWQITDNPNLAIALIIVADVFATIPTLIKSYTNPESEAWQSYAASSFGFLLGLLSINVWSFENAAFVTYLFLATTALALFSSRTKNIPVKAS